MKKAINECAVFSFLNPFCHSSFPLSHLFRSSLFFSFCFLSSSLLSFVLAFSSFLFFSYLSFVPGIWHPKPIIHSSIIVVTFANTLTSTIFLLPPPSTSYTLAHTLDPHSLHIICTKHAFHSFIHSFIHIAPFSLLFCFFFLLFILLQHIYNRPRHPHPYAI